MNERIKQLAEEAGFKTNWQHADVQAIKMARFEKFAQLIVRECAKVCLDPNHWYEDAAGETYNRAFKKHFGVKE